MKGLPLWAAMVGEQSDGKVTLQYDAGKRNPTLAFKIALNAFARGDRSRLADLIKRGVAIPAEHCDAVAEIIAGTRKPSRRGLHSAILTDSQRRLARMDVESFREQRDAFLACAEDASIERGNVTTKDVCDEIWAAYENAISELAEVYGISPSYLEKIAKPSGQ
jgi:hypothetical protein